MTLNKLIYTPSFCMPGFIYMFFAVSLEILRNEYTVVKQVFWTFYIYLIGHVPKLMISVFLFFMLLGKESFFFFFFFSWIHEMKLYQILYCFLSFYLKGVYDIHAGKHKHAHTITQEASSLGFQERTFICLLLCDDISLSRILQFFPVFKFLFRDLGHQILQGKNGKICNCWKCTKCSFS